MGEPGQRSGQRVAHYDILEQLGAGGMGVVYRALDTRLNRTVAVKFLPHQLGIDPRRKARFLQEARAAAALDHGNVGTVHSIEETPDGQIFLVMAYYDGQPLSALLNQRRLSPAEALAIAIQIAHGLAAAHRQGIIHRDIKPSNVIITRDGTAKIVDFGLARFSGSEHITETGATVGTAAYMAPEQALGQETDGRTDIWSLGIVLYQMITGALPFSGESTHSILYKVVHEPAAPAPGLPGPLAGVIERALAKDLSARYASAQEFAADLERVQAGHAVETPTATILTPVVSPAKHKRFAAWGSMAIVITLVFLAAISPSRRWMVRFFLPAPAAAAPKHIVVLPFRNIGNDPEFAALCDGLTEVLTSRLTSLENSAPSLWVIPASEVRRKNVSTEQEAKTQLGATLAISGSVQKTGNNVQLALNLVDASSLRLLASRVLRSPAGDLAALEDEAFKDIGELLAVHTVSIQGAASAPVAPGAYEAYLRAEGLLRRSDKPGNVDEAIRALHQAVEQDPRFALAYSGLAEAEWSRWVTSKDPKWLDAVSSDANKALSLDPQIASAHISLAEAYEASRNPELAVDELHKALQLDPRSADAMRALGRIWERMGRVQDAEAKFQEAVSLHPDYWQGHHDYALFLDRQGRFAEAEREYRRVLQLAPDNATAYSNLGGLLVGLDRLDEARRMFEKSISISPSYFALANLATVLDQQGHLPEAARTYEQALKLNDKDYRVWAYLAWEYECLHDAKARPILEHAAAMAEKARERESNSPDLLADLSYYSAKLGRTANALELARQATLLAPSDAHTLRRTALAFELAGARDSALKNIAAALQHGAGPDTFTKDPELKGLVADKRFGDVLAAAKKNSTNRQK